MQKKINTFLWLTKIFLFVLALFVFIIAFMPFLFMNSKLKAVFLGIGPILKSVRIITATSCDYSSFRFFFIERFIDVWVFIL